MRYILALKIANRIKSELSPYCYRIEIAGSIRRKSKLVNDIELIIIPKPYLVGKNSSGIADVINQWEKIRGELPCRYTKRMLPEGITVDIFFTTLDNWGLTLATRTGPAEFSHKVLGRAWKMTGAKSIQGSLYKHNTKLVFKEEKDLFKFLEIPYIKPEDRTRTMTITSIKK